MIKKNDLFLIAAVLAIAFAILIGVRFWQKKNTGDSAVVVVTVKGQVYGTYPLNEDYQEKITFKDGSYNTLSIKDGKVSVSDASCPDQICVKHLPIHYSKESIVCLPNKLVIDIKGGQNTEVDTIAN